MTTAAHIANVQEDPAKARKPDGQECACEAVPVVHEHQGDAVLKIYRYQPKDREQRPLGGVQVIKYKDEQDLADQMAAQNSELVRLNRELKWQSHKPAVADVPADAERRSAAQAPKTRKRSSRRWREPSKPFTDSSPPTCGRSSRTCSSRAITPKSVFAG